MLGRTSKPYCGIKEINKAFLSSGRTTEFQKISKIIKDSHRVKHSFRPCPETQHSETEEHDQCEMKKIDRNRWKPSIPLKDLFF